ncbi:hypothetical protein [Pseudomonas sp. SMN5]|uniref:hypothetical protein n=1 Tax=Pseudomonas sp. SMN5 TaxID=3390198 RepID=UPI003F872022
MGDGICAAQSCFGERETSLADEMQDYLQDWMAGFNPHPTDDMIAAWLIGFSRTLATHFKLLQEN